MLAIYTKEGTNPLNWSEQHLYGSSRLGLWQWIQAVPATAPVVINSPIFDEVQYGNRQYELGNHLGNVLATISDKKIGVALQTDGSLTDHYEADVVSAQDYYPFGMLMPGRATASASYRYGFNGKENDNEVKGEGRFQDYGMRSYDPLTGRFISMDPIASDYPWYTPYQFAGNKPIIAADLDGLEEWMKSQELAVKRRAQIQMMRAEQRLQNTAVIRPYNPADRSWTQKWRDSKNFLANITYDAANGLYTLPQQLGSSLTGQRRISNIGGDTYDAKGIFGANQRIENGVNGLTMLMPGAAAEGKATSLFGKYSNRLLTKIENEVTDQAPLLTELANKGIAHTPADILNIGRNSVGKIIFLEKGNAKAGLQHILNHADEFATVGIPKSDIANVVFEAATKGKQVGMQGSRSIYEIMYKGETKNIAVTVGNNGYIVGANPTTKIK